MKLKLGIMKNQELADWFGIKLKSFTNSKKRKLEELKEFCSFELIWGGVNIKEIYEENYYKSQKYAEYYIKQVQESKNKICSVAGMTRKAIAHDDFEARFNTLRKRLAKAGHETFGKIEKGSLESYGKIGKRTSIWCIKEDDYNNYKLMTPKEEKLFDDLMFQYQGTEEAKEQIKRDKLLKRQWKAKEITDEEFLECMSGKDWFDDVLKEFMHQTGNIVIHASLHEIYAGVAD